MAPENRLRHRWPTTALFAVTAALGARMVGWLRLAAVGPDDVGPRHKDLHAVDPEGEEVVADLLDDPKVARLDRDEEVAGEGDRPLHEDLVADLEARSAHAAP